MKLTIRSTSKIVELNGVPARIWEGSTDSGVQVLCFVTLVSVSKEESAEVLQQFEIELEECDPPSLKVEAIPSRLIL